MEQHTKMNSNRRRNYRNYEKPQWQLEKERIEREKEEARQKAVEKTEENFPALGKAPVKSTTWGGAKKFTDLVSEWKEADEERKEVEKRQKAQEEEMRKQKLQDRFVMPYFTPQHRFVETEDEEMVVAPTSTSEMEEDTWTTIDSSVKKQAQLLRREQRHEENLRRMDAGEESESSMSEEEEEDSCWNQVAPIGKSYS